MEHSLVSWIQIPCTNLVRGSKFYKEVFGASFQFETLNNIPHALFKSADDNEKLMNGALIEVDQIDSNKRGVVLFFDATGNFEMIMQLIEEFGGKILIPKTLITNRQSEGQSIIPNTYIDNKPGYYAHFLDSEGNKMGLYGSN